MPLLFGCNVCRSENRATFVLEKKIVLTYRARIAHAQAGLCLCCSPAMSVSMRIEVYL